MTQTAPSILTLDREALKVLAHPLRSRLLTALRMGGPATATALARELETNSGATSYHLRRLASVGLVEETEEGRGRERPWRAATEMHGWTERAIAGDPDAEAATDWLRRHYLRTFVGWYEKWLDEQGSWPIDWQDAAGASDFALRVTAEQLAEFNAEFQALVMRYRRDDPLPGAPDPGHAADPEARMVEVYIHAIPIRENRP